MTHLSRISISSFFLFLLSFNALADFSVYTIDNKFKAPFPGRPELSESNSTVDEFAKREDVVAIKGYNYIDHNNALAYTANYIQSVRGTFPKTNVKKGLELHMKGSVIAVNGTLISKRFETVNGRSAVIFSLRYNPYGYDIIKHTILSYKDDCFYSWSVQHSPSMSRKDGGYMFNRYYENFRIIN